MKPTTIYPPADRKAAGYLALENRMGKDIAFIESMEGYPTGWAIQGGKAVEVRPETFIVGQPVAMPVKVVRKPKGDAGDHLNACFDPDEDTFIRVSRSGVVVEEPAVWVAEANDDRVPLYRIANPDDPIYLALVKEWNCKTIGFVRSRNGDWHRKRHGPVYSLALGDSGYWYKQTDGKVYFILEGSYGFEAVAPVRVTREGDRLLIESGGPQPLEARWA